ncbi:hypothetical protein E8E12_004284 [Didymella heteroderae]|uniref:Uncharacterized protein n=1 Tax=Didymella heteroderae TaxID=1769908 RepID=A0A9P4WLB0_9PLEO|nr:hypothetical protein E8E12_004284 [Didymella heteroderae]
MASTTYSTSSRDLLHRITTNAARDNIDFTVLTFYQEALDSIKALSSNASTTPLPDFTTATKIDTHTHPIPSWFRDLELSAAGRETPSWNLHSHLSFMAERGIKRSILSVSTPQANAFASPSKFEGDAELRRKKTVALARLLNENAELTSKAPLRSGLGEFYFETARAISSLTASSSPYYSALLKYPSLHWRVSHGAGAFPDISERFLLGFPSVSAAAREAYKSRLWYDSAGPVWPNQIKGIGPEFSILGLGPVHTRYSPIS